MKPSEIKHPDYVKELAAWNKFRYVMGPSDRFINKYLKDFSSREDALDFSFRKSLTYSPAFAKSAIYDIRNAIVLRMHDITRTQLPPSFNRCLDGDSAGVDLSGGSMNAFMSDIILELISMRKVGVWVDNFEVPEGATKADTNGLHPYLYFFGAEKIVSWAKDPITGEYTAVLIETEEQVPDESGLITDSKTVYRFVRKTDSGVQISYLNTDGSKAAEDKLLPIERVPFITPEIPFSLLEEVANHQISLLNLSSSDVAFAIRSNFSFYVEQFDPKVELSYLKRPNNDGSVSEGNTAQQGNNVTVGGVHGRRYATGLERPAYINPSPEPLRASMEKQDKIRNEIRQLVNLSLINLDPSRKSAETREYEDRGLEAGLAYIASKVEAAERDILRIWTMYTNEENNAVIKYPVSYNLKTSEDQLDEAKAILETGAKIQSISARKEYVKAAVKVTLAHRITRATLEQIFQEIDEAEIIVINTEELIEELNAGLVGNDLASKLLGFPKGESEKAKQDHADRLARIAEAQSTGVPSKARGNADGVDDGDLEKSNSQGRVDEYADGKKKVKS